MVAVPTVTGALTTTIAGISFHFLCNLVFDWEERVVHNTLAYITSCHAQPVIKKQTKNLRVWNTITTQKDPRACEKKKKSRKYISFNKAQKLASFTAALVGPYPNSTTRSITPLSSCHYATEQLQAHGRTTRILLRLGIHPTMKRHSKGDKPLGISTCVTSTKHKQSMWPTFCRHFLWSLPTENCKRTHAILLNDQ